MEEKNVDLTKQELIIWENLTNKACQAYKYHTEELSKLLKISEVFAKSFDYN